MKLTRSHSTHFQLGSLLILSVNMILLVFGLIYAIRADLMPYHLEFIGIEDYEGIASLYPNIAILARLMIMLIGFLFLSNGIVNLAIWYVGFRKGSRWAWVSSLGAALILIPLMFVIYIVAGFGFPFPVGFTCLILWLIAMLFTAKEALSSKR